MHAESLAVALPRPAALQPTPEAERLHALDAMRGAAILGVLAAYTVWSLGSPPPETWSALDRALARAMDLLVDTKCYTLFATLFGVGVTQQWRRWEEAGFDPVPLHLRRMGFLLLVGLLHAALLRNGDILAPYALMGTALLCFRHRAARTLAAWAIGLALVPTLVHALRVILHWPWPARPTVVAGGYLAENLAWLRFWYLTNPLVAFPGTLALMLAGSLLGRARVIERLAADRARAGRVLAVAATVAVLTRLGLDRLNVLLPLESRLLAQRLALDLLYQLNAWSLAAGYGSAMLLAARWPRVAAALWPLRATGRMAFTNYLSQACVIVPACLAFGLFDKVSPARGVAMALVLGTAQVVFSTLWLRRFRMGPLERAWRGATYGAGQVSLRR